MQQVVVAVVLFFVVSFVVIIPLSFLGVPSELRGLLGFAASLVAVTVYLVRTDPKRD